MRCFGSHREECQRCYFDPRSRRPVTRVATGFGDKVDPAGKYQWHKGDIAVWSGGAHGHIEMCVGSGPNGAPIWKSDFKSQESNWSGLLNPDSHGSFFIYRSKNVAAALDAVDKIHKPSGPFANSSSSNDRAEHQKGFTANIPYTSDSSMGNMDSETKLEVAMLFEILTTLFGQSAGVPAAAANPSAPQPGSAGPPVSAPTKRGM